FVDYGDGSEEEAVKTLMREYNKCGITMGVNAMGSVDDIKLMKKLQDNGEQTVRVRYTLPAVDAVAKAAMETDAGDREFARVEFLKNFLDGEFLTGTAFMEHPYHGLYEIFGIDTHGEDDYGMVLLSEEELADKIRLARKYGLKYGAHCVGSGASRRLLNAYKIVDAENSIKGERHSLIHADFMDGNAIADANSMGISILFQPAWHYVDAPYLDKFLHPDDMARFMKYTTILTADLAAAGSDHMVKHDPNESVNPYNPFLGMYNMVTCRARDGKAYGAETAVGREHALIAYTRDAARVCFDENTLGTLEVGKFADFAVLDNNYFTCSEEEIPDIRSVMTVVDGKRVW
ncbi:MAG: amidohydrolase family protein, partial [Oscillospiraceae bacterium]|nr:amidohydrolase family protein [Oscillospiraceae bacterium]